MKQIAIFTHHDLDGIFSAFLLQQFYQKQDNTKCIVRNGSAGYQTKHCINFKLCRQPLLYYDRIILTDFVPTRNNCKRLLAWQAHHCNSVIIFDHHEQSYALAQEFSQLTFILPTKKTEYISASLLVANWLKQQDYELYQKYLTFAQCVSAYDTFAFSLQKGNPFYLTAPRINMLFYHLGIKKFLTRINTNTSIDDFSVSEIQFFEHEEQQIKFECERIKWQHLAYQIHTNKNKTVKVWLLPYIPKYASEISNYILTKYPCLDIIILGNGQHTIFRTRKTNLNMDKLAHFFGGGGHLKAAGANTSWIKVRQYLEEHSGG